MSEVILFGLVVVAGAAGIWALSWRLSKQAPSSKRRPRKPPLRVRPRAGTRRKR